MKYAYLNYPLEDDIDEYLDHIVNKFTRGNMSTKEFHVNLGKALAYTEAQFSTDRINKEKTYNIINEIEEMLE